MNSMISSSNILLQEIIFLFSENSTKLADIAMARTFQNNETRDMIGLKNHRSTWVSKQITMKSGKDISLNKLRKLDPDTIAAVHQEYFPELFRYACYRLGDATIAEDMASEVLLTLLEAVEKGKGPKTTLRGWLMGTAANLINEYFRKMYNRPLVDLDDNYYDDSNNPILHAEEMDEANTVRMALQYLTPDQQHVLALRFSNRFSLEETAAVMEKKVNAIKALQFRALSALRREIEKINQ